MSFRASVFRASLLPALLVAGALCALLGVGMAARAAPAQAIDAVALMQLLASVESATSTFVETRYSALLKKPLVSRGVLIYRRGEGLEKHVEYPRDERLVLRGGQLTIQSADGSKDITMNSGNSDLAGLVEGVRAVRTGELATLERHFQVQVDGAREHWRLHLVPRASALARYVSAMTVSGAGERLQQIEVLEASGDRTVMVIQETTR